MIADLHELLNEIQGRTHGLARYWQAIAQQYGYRGRSWSMMLLEPLRIWVLDMLREYEHI
jgi:hypothetical protein